MKFPVIPGLEDESQVSFEVVDVDLPAFVQDEHGDRLTSFLAAVAKTYQRDIDSLTYVFCSDEELHRMNVEFLDHDTYTDIITFDLADETADGDDFPSALGDSESFGLSTHENVALQSGAPILGECYISLDRVRDNAAGFGESPERELLRVMVHGLLHLCGLGDKTPAEIAAMRAAESAALAEWSSS